MHEMWSIAIDDPERLSVTRLRYANTAEWIDVLLGVEPFVDPRNIVAY